MLSLYQTRLELKSPLATPLASGTIFGHLCWAYREVFSEDALVKWLKDYENVWAVSDGFPKDLLPRPILKLKMFNPDNAPTNKDFKAIKKKKYITFDGFKAIRNNITEENLETHLRNYSEKSVRNAHNNIDRKTGTTPKEGGLYFLDEIWTKPAPRPMDENGDTSDRFRDIYINAPQNSEKVIAELFNLIGQNGFGKDATTGRGQWEVRNVTRDETLGATNGNRCLSLSRGVIDDQNMHDIRCRVETHYGRTSANHTGISPFKYPLLLSLPGMTFKNNKRPRYGEIIQNVHPDRPEIIHNGFHVTLTYSEQLDDTQEA